MLRNSKDHWQVRTMDFIKDEYCLEEGCLWNMKSNQFHIFIQTIIILVQFSVISIINFHNLNLTMKIDYFKTKQMYLHQFPNMNKSNLTLIFGQNLCTSQKQKAGLKSCKILLEAQKKFWKGLNIKIKIMRTY